MTTGPPARNIRESGFALGIVLWALVIVSIVALTLATLVRSEVQAAIGREGSLQAELLAESGLAFADYLANRSLGAADENLGGIPANGVVPGFHYRIAVPEGEIDLYFEGEGGKIDLSAASLPLLASFFREWTGSDGDGARISAALAEWRRGPATSGTVGAAAPLTLDGLSREDLLPRVVDDGNQFVLRPGLDAFVTTDPVGAAVNPNLAPRMVLASIPGVSERAAEAIVAARSAGPIADLDQLARIAGPLPVSAATDFGFDTPVPAVLAIGRPDGGNARRSIRRVSHTTFQLDTFLGTMVSQAQLNRVERDPYPEFIVAED